MREIQSPDVSGKGQARADDERRYRIRWHRPADPAGEWAAGFEATNVTRTTCTLEEAADAAVRS